MGNNSDICLDPYKVIFNFSSYNECIKSSLEDNVCTSFKQISKISEKNLSTEEVKVLNNFFKNKNILIQKVSKGNNTVILNRSDYI